MQSQNQKEKKMGREIRRVPKDWEHPKDSNNNYIPMYDEVYEDAANRWIKGFLAWIKGDHDYQIETGILSGTNTEGGTGYKYYWDYDGPPPNPKNYRPAFRSDPIYFQIYQTVSEGSPVSPVFETEKEILYWLIKENYSEKAARAFIDTGHAPTIVVVDGVLYDNIHAMEVYLHSNE